MTFAKSNRLYSQKLPRTGRVSLLGSGSQGWLGYALCRNCRWCDYLLPNFRMTFILSSRHSRQHARERILNFAVAEGHFPRNCSFQKRKKRIAEMKYPQFYKLAMKLRGKGRNRVPSRSLSERRSPTYDRVISHVRSSAASAIIDKNSAIWLHAPARCSRCLKHLQTAQPFIRCEDSKRKAMGLSLVITGIFHINAVLRLTVPH